MTLPIRLLLIEDNKSDRALIIRELQREFEALQVQEIISSGEFNRALCIGEFDAVITDFQLRWMTGLDILIAVKQRYPHCPVIMFTNTGTEEIAVEAMKLGLDDYILKTPTRYVRVPASVRVAIERATAQQQAELLEIRFRTLLEQLRIGVFRISETGELLECNSAFLTLLGVNSISEAQSIIGQLRCTLLESTSFSALSQAADSSLPETQKQEVELDRGDGQSIRVLLTTVVAQAGGRVVIDGLLEEM